MIKITFSGNYLCPVHALAGYLFRQGYTLARCLVIPEEYMVNARKSSLTGIYDTHSVSGYNREQKGVLCGPSSVDITYIYIL